MIMKPEADFIILCDSGKSEEIIERLFRVGYFNVKGYADFKVEEDLKGLLKTKFVKLS